MPDTAPPPETPPVPKPGTGALWQAGPIPVAVALLALSGYTLFTAAALPAPQGWPTSPALFPMAVAVALASTSLMLLIQLLSGRWHRRVLPSRPAAPDQRRDVAPAAERYGSALAQFLLLGFYVFVLLPAASFESATALYLLGAGLLAERRPPAFGRLLTLIALPPAFVLIAAGLLGLPLPGSGSLVLQLLDAAGQLSR